MDMAVLTNVTGLYKIPLGRTVPRETLPVHELWHRNECFRKKLPDFAEFGKMTFYKQHMHV